ncbi:hypothetical protein EMCG_01814 [[Emmonsia] crescens]|uniref:Uncharacterized protein n=1 Tax=[Emmonsia] crescens TaxID=73230 RepID=A0A0G2J9E9_9EURO|nr:hypothetical protein EMCG_01814 [Emmonsia crescens UAMH 3008]
MLIICLGENLREHLNHLEVLPASVKQSHAIETTPAIDAGSSNATTNGSCSSNSSPHIVAMSPPAYAVSDGSASTSSVITPGECQYLLPLLEEGKAALSMWDSSTNIMQPTDISAALGM